MNDSFFEKALELAEKGVGFTSPNPAVGAVLVKGGKIIGEGWHRYAGGAHAEVIAIEAAGVRAKGADLYVTLEPCCHVGKTGACCEAIVEAGIKKVFVGMKDPNPKVNGKGINFLRKNGVEVEILFVKSALAKEIRDLNQPFIKSMKTSLPYVILKAGISLDGRIATSEGDSKWITGEVARKDARLERSRCDAVLVGAGTVLVDDCELGAHGKYKNKKLMRVVLSKNVKLSPQKRIFRDENVLEIKNIKSVKSLLRSLFKKGIQSVFVEGGSQIHGLFFDAALRDKNLLDRVLFYIAPKLIGGRDSLSVIGGKGIGKLNQAIDFKEYSLEILEQDLKFSGIVNEY